MDSVNVKSARHGILLLYHRPVGRTAPTIDEHVGAWARHSAFNVWPVNTEFGCPLALKSLRFDVLVLHYSLFGTWPYRLDRGLLEFLYHADRSFKIAFVQDEHRFCSERFAFLNEYKVDCVYSLLEPADAERVYGTRTAVRDIQYTIPGYVSDDLCEAAKGLTRPDHERRVDIGYRGRRLDFYMGRGGQEKHEIGAGVRARAAAADLTVDIDTEEQSRLYGQRWYRFLSNCRAVLGVEAGVSIFDIDDVVRPACARLLAERPEMSFEDVHDRVLRQWEGNIPYRTISPRHFEAAAFRVCQILFTGRYSGILQPMVHYIPLEKDFSNWHDVVRRFRDEPLRTALTENAYRDLIASRQYSYGRFIDAFDRHLISRGFDPAAPDRADVDDVDGLLRRGRLRQRVVAWARYGRQVPFPGRSAAVSVKRAVLKHARGVFAAR